RGSPALVPGQGHGGARRARVVDGRPLGFGRRSAGAAGRGRGGGPGRLSTVSPGTRRDGAAAWAPGGHHDGTLAARPVDLRPCAASTVGQTLVAGSPDGGMASVHRWRARAASDGRAGARGRGRGATPPR